MGGYMLMAGLGWGLVWFLLSAVLVAFSCRILGVLLLLFV